MVKSRVAPREARRPADKARRGSILDIFDRGATQFSRDASPLECSGTFAAGCQARVLEYNGLTWRLSLATLPTFSGIYLCERIVNMTSTEDRIRNLISENLEIDGSALDLNGGLTDAGVSSMDLVAFAKVVAKEFNVAFTPDDCANLKSIRELIARLDAS